MKTEPEWAENPFKPALDGQRNCSKGYDVVVQIVRGPIVASILPDMSFNEHKYFQKWLKSAHN